MPCIANPFCLPFFKFMQPFRGHDHIEPSMPNVLQVCESTTLVVSRISPVFADAILGQNVVIDLQHILPLRHDPRDVPPIAMPQIRQRYLLNQSFHTCCFAPIARTPISHTAPLIDGGYFNPCNIATKPMRYQFCHVTHLLFVSGELGCVFRPQFSGLAFVKIRCYSRR